MALPIINFKFTSTESDQSLQDLVTSKFESLERLWSDSDPVTIDVEFAKAASHQNGPIYQVEANLRIDGTLYRAEATMESFTAAIDEVRNELDKELSRANDKKDTLIKKGGREIKEMLRGNQ